MKHTKFMKSVLSVFSAAAIGASCLSFCVSATGLDPSETAPYTVFMSVQAGAESLWDPAEENSVEFSVDGTYELNYTFTQGSASIEAVIIDSSINAYAFAPEECSDPIAEGSVQMTIDSIVLNRVDGTVDTIEYTGPSTGAFRTGDNGTCIRYNILNNWTSPKVADIPAELPGEGAGEGDVLTVTFTITGIGGSSDVMYGDVDGDGAIGLSDASAILGQYATKAAGGEGSFDEAQMKAADVNADGSIDLSDASAVLKYYAAAAAGMNPVISDYFPAAAQ